MFKFSRLKSLKLKKALKAEGVVLVYLFGSFARGEAHQESDIDIAVLFDKKIKEGDYLKREGKLIGVFSEIYQGREVNLTNLNISPPLLKQSVILEGKVIYEKSKIERIFFQVFTLHEYEDYLHLSRIYNQFLEAKIRSL